MEMENRTTVLGSSALALGGLALLGFFLIQVLTQFAGSMFFLGLSLLFIGTGLVTAGLVLLFISIR